MGKLTDENKDNTKPTSSPLENSSSTPSNLADFKLAHHSMLDSKVDSPKLDLQKPISSEGPKKEEPLNSPPKTRGTTAFDYATWEKIQADLKQEKTVRYYFGSVFLHGLLAAFVIFSAFKVYEETQDKKPETVEIEIAETTPAPVLDSSDTGDVKSSTAPNLEKTSSEDTSPDAPLAKTPTVTKSPMTPMTPAVPVPSPVMAPAPHPPEPKVEKPAPVKPAPPAPKVVATPTPTPAPEVAASNLSTPPLPAPKPRLTPPVSAPPEEPVKPKAVAVPMAPPSLPETEEELNVPTPAPAPARPVAKTPVKVQTAPSPVEVPDSVDDIKEPELEKHAVAPVPTKKINPEDVRKELAKAEQQHKKKLADTENEIEEQNKKALAETDAAADDLNAETEQEAQKIANYNAARRARDAQAIAAAQASEQAAAARKAQEARRAKEAAAAAAAARAAQEAAAAKAAQEKADEERRAAVAATANQPGEGRGGDNLPEGVRDLGELRQMPNNPIPKYDANERLQRQEGVVVFLAFISQDGSLSQFRLLDSTGHRNLDGKTLAALKQWKFQPGQEGWVEIPFNWTLKGGPQEMPALLRRKK